MHVLDSDEIFHFYLGDPVEMLQLHPDGQLRCSSLLGRIWPLASMSSSSSPPESGKARASSATAKWPCSAAL